MAGFCGDGDADCVQVTDRGGVRGAEGFRCRWYSRGTSRRRVLYAIQSERSGRLTECESMRVFEGSRSFVVSENFLFFFFFFFFVRFGRSGERWSILACFRDPDVFLLPSFLFRQSGSVRQPSRDPGRITNVSGSRRSETRVPRGRRCPKTCACLRQLRLVEREGSGLTRGSRRTNDRTRARKECVFFPGVPPDSRSGETRA